MSAASSHARAPANSGIRGLRIAVVAVLIAAGIVV